MADISYTPTTWADGAEGGTPVNSTRLNNIESGIVDAVAAIGPNDTTTDGTLKAQIDALRNSVGQVILDGAQQVKFTVWDNSFRVTVDKNSTTSFYIEVQSTQMIAAKRVNGSVEWQKTFN